MFGLCSLSSARSKSVLLVEENFVFYCGHSVLRYVPFAGPAGPAFSFLPFPSFSQRFLSEWKQCWFSPAWGSPLPLSLPTNGSHASNRADNLFRWCVPLPSSQNRTQALTVAYLFSPCSLLTFPLRGKAVLFSKLGCPGFLDSSTTASHGSNGAGLRPLWCRFPTRPSKPHTGPHRGVFGFSVFSFHSFLAAVPLTAAPGDNSPLHEWAKSCRAASRFSRFRPTSTRLSAGFR